MNKSVVILLLIILLIFTSCSDDGITPLKNKIRVAAILDLSAHYKWFGDETKRGMAQFLEDYPDSRLDIIYLDSKGDAAEALRLFDSISVADTNVKAVITLASWISNAVAPAAKQKNILHFAVGSSVFEYPDNGNTVRFTGDVKDEAIYLIDYLKDFQKVGLLYFDNDYGRGWDSSLSNSLGSKLVLSKSYIDIESDFTSVLQEMKTAEPEIIVLISAIEAVKITRQAKQIGITTQLLGNRPILTDSLLNEPTAEGLIFSYPDLDENNPAYIKYVNKFSRKPSSFAAEGYDLMTSLYKTVLNKEFNRESVYNSYRNVTLYGMFSEIKFDSNAQANSKYKLMEVKSGNYQDYK